VERGAFFDYSLQSDTAGSKETILKVDFTAQATLIRILKVIGNT
jgi:hypothetical protein